MTVKSDEDPVTVREVDTEAGPDEVSHPDEAKADDEQADDKQADGVQAGDADVSTGTPPRRPVGPGRRVARGAAKYWIAITLAVVLAVSAGITAWLYFAQYKPDQATGAAASESALNAAKDGTVALLSYSPETLNEDFTNAKTHLTGDFLNYYNQFTEQIVTPAATKKSVKTSAAIVNSAVAELQTDSAVVLVFLNQTTTSAENPDGSFSTSAVKVGLKRVNDAWLISSFDPV